jgi:hypothetical protein
MSILQKPFRSANTYKERLSTRARAKGRAAPADHFVGSLGCFEHTILGLSPSAMISFSFIEDVPVDRYVIQSTQLRKQQLNVTIDKENTYLFAMTVE